MKLSWRSAYSLLLLFLYACTSKPEPFVYGKDNCYTCKMGIIDSRYGAELITRKGKIYKFDDVICLNQLLRSGTIEEKEISRTLVINFEKGNDFLDIQSVTFIVSPELKSPMGSHAGAFFNRENAEKMNVSLKGKLYSWKELSGQLE